MWFDYPTPPVVGGWHLAVDFVKIHKSGVTLGYPDEHLPVPLHVAIATGKGMRTRADNAEIVPVIFNAIVETVIVCAYLVVGRRAVCLENCVRSAFSVGIVCADDVFCFSVCHCFFLFSLIWFVYPTAPITGGFTLCNLHNAVSS